MPTLVEFILLLAATAYLTWVLNNTEGPLNLFAKMRTLPMTVGAMSECYWCASFWVALLNMAFFLYIPELLWVLAVCGFVNGLRTVYLHVAVPRENKVRIDTASYLKKEYGTAYAAKYLELGDMQAAFKAVHEEESA